MPDLEPTPEQEPEPPLQAFEAEPGRVALYDPDGAMQSVPTENAEAAVREYGYRPASKADVVADHEGTYGTIKAGVYGAARGASFGLFDPLAVAASGAVYGEEGKTLAREELNLAREGHGTATLAGEIGGSLLPLAFGAGGGAAVTGEGVLARAASRAASAAPRAALEGAAIAAGQQLTEDTLGNHDLVAQKYVATALEGGLFGALLGVSLHTGIGLAGDKLAARAAAKAGATGGGVASKLGQIAEEQAAKGVLPASTISASELTKLGTTAEAQQGRLRRIGRALLDEGITSAAADKTVQATRLTARVAEVGEELGTLRKGLEKAAVRPSAENVLARVEQEVLAPLMERAFSSAEQAAIRPQVAELAERLKGKALFESFDDLHKLRSDLDAQLYPKARKGFAPPAPPAGAEHLEKIRGILEDEFESAAEHASMEIGEDTAQAYRVKKALYSDLKTAEKWATKASARESQNAAWSLTDTIAASAGVGTAIVTGNPIGLLAPIANKLRRTYGNQAAAVIADKASKILGIQRAAERFDTRVAKAVSGFYEGGKKGRALPSGASPKVTPEAARALRATVSNPTVLNERVSQIVGSTGLHETAPKVAQSMTSTLMRAAAYLHQNLPAEPPPASFSFGPTKPRPLGPHAQAKLEAVAGALDLDGLLGDIERGRVDRQKVEALKIINPDAAEAIIGALERHGLENAAELTHQQEVALSILTGRPIGALMQPRTIRGFQQAHAQGATPDPAQAGVGRQPIGNANSGEPSRSADTFRSGSDRMEADNE